MRTRPRSTNETSGKQCSTWRRAGTKYFLSDNELMNGHVLVLDFQRSHRNDFLN